MTHELGDEEVDSHFKKTVHEMSIKNGLATGRGSRPASGFIFSHSEMEQEAVVMHQKTADGRRENWRALLKRNTWA